MLNFLDVDFTPMKQVFLLDSRLDFALRLEEAAIFDNSYDNQT